MSQLIRYLQQCIICWSQDSLANMSRPYWPSWGTLTSTNKYFSSLIRYLASLALSEPPCTENIKIQNFLLFQLPPFSLYSPCHKVTLHSCAAWWGSPALAWSSRTPCLRSGACALFAGQPYHNMLIRYAHIIFQCVNRSLWKSFSRDSSIVPLV